MVQYMRSTENNSGETDQNKRQSSGSVWTRNDSVGNMKSQTSALQKSSEIFSTTGTWTSLGIAYCQLVCCDRRHHFKWFIVLRCAQISILFV